MRRLNTAVLAVLLLILGAYIYFFELAKDGKGKSDKLLNFESEEVTGVALGYARQEIQLQKEPSGRWRLVQPLQTNADDAAVASLLSSLGTSEIKRTLDTRPGAEDLKSFGLSPPVVRVSVTLKSGLTLPALNVGAKTPLGDSAYVQRGNDPAVYLTGAALAYVLDKDPNDLRDKTILPFAAEQVARLEIQTPGESLRLAKGEKEEWTVETPVKKPAAPDAVNDYLGTLGRIRAKAFIDDQPTDVKKYGLDRPAVKISVGGKDGKSLATLEIGAKSGDAYYVRREGAPTVYSIDESSYKLVQKFSAGFIAEEKQEPKK